MDGVDRRDEDRDGYRMSTLLLWNKTAREEVPAILLEPKEPIRQTVVWIDPAGKQALFDASGAPAPAVRTLLSGGTAVLGIDLFGQGEFTPDGKPIEKAPLLTESHWDRYLGYTYGYNHSLFSKRVHDILTAVAYARKAGDGRRPVSLLGLRGAGAWVAAAYAQAGQAIHRAAIDTAGFRFAALDRLDHPDFLPGGAKYHDLPGIIALAAPGELWLAGEERVPGLVEGAYKAVGHPERLTAYRGAKSEVETKAVEWLLR